DFSLFPSVVYGGWWGVKVLLTSSTLEALKKKCVPNSASAGSTSGASPIAGTPDQPAVITSMASPLAANVSGEQSTAASVTAAIIDVVSQSSPGPSTTQPPEDDKKPSKPKNRCDTCKKKVGLTGFDCRCGGLYCSLHRYSDKHDCSFNYIEQGAAEIRRNNPQIMGQKINKI
ncbi:unnamed protein product, partial [Allacma fusca]